MSNIIRHNFTAHSLRSFEAQISQRWFIFLLSAEEVGKQKETFTLRSPVRQEAIKFYFFKYVIKPNYFSLNPTAALGFYVFRPLNGKHKENRLCELCASAVNFIYSTVDEVA